MRWMSCLFVCLMVIPGATGLIAHEAPATYLVTLQTTPLTPDQHLTLTALGAQVTAVYDVSGTLAVQMAPSTVPRIQGLSFVQAVEHDHPVEPLLESSKQASGLTQELYEAGLTGQGVNIALVDSGIDQDHPALRDRVVADIAFGPDGTTADAASSSEHGTHVAGILVSNGAASDGEDLKGVAPGSGLVSLDLSDQFTTSNALRAFEWIYDNHEEHNIHVVANSWGRQRDQATYDPDDPVIRATDALVEEGLVVVFSSGNGGDQPGRMTLEATNPNVITVGAVDDKGQVEAYSSRGPIYDDNGSQADWTKPDLVAPGTHIVSTRDGGGTARPYTMMNGTSMAAPHVAGAAALLKSLQPGLTPAQVKGILMESARDVAAPGIDDQTGAGMLDIRASVALLEASESRTIQHWEVVARDEGQLRGPSQAGTVLDQASVEHSRTIPFQVPANATELQIQITWEASSEMEASLVDPQGRTVSKVTVDGERTLERPDPEQGGWHLELSSQGLREGSYDASVSVGWTESRDGTGLPVSAMRASDGGGFPVIGTHNPFGPSLLPGVPNIVPMLAGGAISVLLMVGRYTAKRR